MIDKEPGGFWWLPYVWVFVLSVLGGLVNFANKVSKGHTTWRSWGLLAAELLTSIFVGVITFLLCRWQGWPDLLSAAMTGVAAHMGTRALMQFEKLWGRMFGLNAKD